jgi:hypothetical protein
LLFVDGRRRALGFDEIRSAAADSPLIAPAATASSKSFWLYMRAPFPGAKLAVLY